MLRTKLSVIWLDWKQHNFSVLSSCRLLFQLKCICGKFHFSVLIVKKVQLKLFVCSRKNAPAERTCRKWFERFKFGFIFDTEDREHPGTLINFEDEELEALSDQDPRQTGCWKTFFRVSIAARTTERGGVFASDCYWWWIHFNINSETRYPWIEGAMHLRLTPSTIDAFEPSNQRKMGINWDQTRPIDFSSWQCSPHVAKQVKNYLDYIGWDVSSHPPYSPDIASSENHLFRSMQHDLVGRRFQSSEEIKIWLDGWIRQKD